jgi:guanylate kinase
MFNKKILIIGKSASGKDFLIEFLKNKGLKRSVSYTTRPIRDNEIPGETYHYVSESEFERMIEDGELIEYHNFNEWYYGNTIDDFNEKDVFIKTVYGLRQIKDYRNQCFIIYIDIDSETRRQRLINRKDSNDDIERRIEADEKDFEGFYDCDLRITNPDYNPEEIFQLISNL